MVLPRPLTEDTAPLENGITDHEEDITGKIEQHMQSDRHRIWGFVIYRTTYQSDEGWERFLRQLDHEMKAALESLDRYNSQDFMDKFGLAVFDDRNEFDGASTHKIRSHFQRWCVQAYKTEQRAGLEFVAIGRSQRYIYAVQVDEEAMLSVIAPWELSASLEHLEPGWVRLIDKRWYLGKTEHSSSDDYDPIEGVAERDVGWMKVPFKDVMTKWYVDMRDVNNWQRRYTRPPNLAS
jgi:hypothetical protein